MQVALMSHRTTAPQIEALEPECWGVSWGVGLSECPQAIDMHGNTGKELELARRHNPCIHLISNTAVSLVFTMVLPNHRSQV